MKTPIKPISLRVSKLDKIKGSRGSWVATFNGETLPVLHNSWRVGIDQYLDPMNGAKLEGKRYKEYVALLYVVDKIILQRDFGNGDLGRDGYIGVFSFSELKICENGAISLRLTHRIL